MSENEETIAPGQIWLIEQAVGAALSPLDRAALTGANVVIYDRALEPLVARVLPIGSYAEPLAGQPCAAGSVISARALGFAAEGWSVVRLVEAGSGWRARLDATARLLVRFAGFAASGIRVVAKTAPEPQSNRDVRLSELVERIDEIAGGDLLTVVFEPLAAQHPARSCAFTANGLAG